MSSDTWNDDELAQAKEQLEHAAVLCDKAAKAIRGRWARGHLEVKYAERQNSILAAAQAVYMAVEEPFWVSGRPTDEQLEAASVRFGGLVGRSIDSKPGPP